MPAHGRFRPSAYVYMRAPACAGAHIYIRAPACGGARVHTYARARMRARVYMWRLHTQAPHAYARPKHDCGYSSTTHTWARAYAYTRAPAYAGARICIRAGPYMSHVRARARLAPRAHAHGPRNHSARARLWRAGPVIARQSMRPRHSLCARARLSPRAHISLRAGSVPKEVIRASKCSFFSLNSNPEQIVWALKGPQETNSVGPKGPTEIV